MPDMEIRILLACPVCGLDNRIGQVVVIYKNIEKPKDVENAITYILCKVCGWVEHG